MNTCGIHHINHEDYTRCPKCANQLMNTGEKALAAALRHITELHSGMALLEAKIDALEAKVKTRQTILANVAASAVEQPTWEMVEALRRDLQAAEEHIGLLNLANADAEAALHGRLIASNN